MKLAEIKEKLAELDRIGFRLPEGRLVPRHFHVTEVGKVSKHFIDCGGNLRSEEVVSFQLWDSNDYDHRLHPEKLIHIIELSQKTLGLSDELEIEVEYQDSTIGKFGLGFDGKDFLLLSLHTDCLAKDKCGVSQPKPKVKLSELEVSPCCSSKSGCC